MVLLLNAGFMLLSALISFFNEMDTGFYPLLLSFVLTLALGMFPLIFVRPESDITTKESYVIVVGSWLLACFVGTFPYMLWGGEFNPINAWFESTSGFTATGSTILRNIEALPKGMLFWRSSTHWLGGVGVVMFAMVILPSLGKIKATLSNMEISTFAKENYHYKTKKILQILLFVYIGLTLLETVLLRVAGMDWFDAVNHSFSTIATGGLSPKNASIAYYDNVWIEAVIFFFMVVSGLHFGLIFATLTGKSNNLFRSEVARLYLLFILVGGALISFNLWFTNSYESLPTAFRHGYFQFASILTTTGFSTADSTFWPPFSVMLLILASIICGCAGSTSGGVKVDRVLLSYKGIAAKLKQQQHPNAIIRIKINNVHYDDKMVGFASIFIVCYLAAVGVGTVVCTLFGSDLMTSFSIAFGSMSNVGPGFGQVGSMSNYAELPEGTKIVSSLLMLLGRLEVFGFIQMFLLRSWR
jgi:trk system potassium uptake protein TrkH